MMLQLDPLIPVETPKGFGMAYFLINPGPQAHLEWVVFIDDTGECWTFENPDVRLQPNLTEGRSPKEHIWRSHWNT